MHHKNETKFAFTNPSSVFFQYEGISCFAYLNTCFEKESERKSPIVIAIEMLKGLFQLPSVFLSVFL